MGTEVLDEEQWLRGESGKTAKSLYPSPFPSSPFDEGAALFDLFAPQSTHCREAAA